MSDLRPELRMTEAELQAGVEQFTEDGPRMAEPTKAEWEAIKARLTPEQTQRIKAKCQWEHCSWLAVYRDWPDLFKEPPNV